MSKKPNPRSMELDHLSPKEKHDLHMRLYDQKNRNLINAVRAEKEHEQDHWGK